MRETPYLTDHRHAQWLAHWLEEADGDSPAQRRAALAALRLLRQRLTTAPSTPASQREADRG